MALVVPFVAQAQTVKPAIRAEAIPTSAFVREEKLNSKLMARQMPYNLIVPENYDAPSNKAKKYSVIYFSVEKSLIDEQRNIITKNLMIVPFACSTGGLFSIYILCEWIK